MVLRVANAVVPMETNFLVHLAHVDFQLIQGKGQIG